MIEAILRAETIPKESDYTLAPDILLLLVQDGSVRLLDLKGNCYTMAPIGGKMLVGALEGDSAAALHIATEYHAELFLVRDDMQTFLADLESKKLIFQRRGPISKNMRRPRKTPLLFWLLAPFLRSACALPFSLESKAWLLLTLAFLSLRMSGWSETLELWRQQFPNHKHKKVSPELEPYAKLVDQLIRTRAAHHLFHVDCKERALSCWGLLRSAGFSARLVMGIHLFPLECHCWCEAGAWVLSDDQDRCKQFTPITSYE
ncbi:MAG TPA: lasso peptide biosynthesis B2 protein [Ktedonobacteraceae bacterium]|nr:lasso peptide biosynthesis B2 protein [Ktedonobacteraceae bacterium]